MNSQREQISRGQSFVTYAIERIKKDNGIASALRRADNPATEYQSWELLAKFNIELDKSYERIPFATIAAALAKAKVEKNGIAGIGQTLAGCYEDGSESDQAKSKLRRLLACDSVEEVCRILRPIFSLIESRNNGNLNFSKLLDDLLKFNFNAQRIKSQWAQDFYRHTAKAEVK